MSLEMALEEYPKDVELKGFACKLRPLEATDELAFHEFFLAVPNQEAVASFEERGRPRPQPFTAKHVVLVS